MDIPLKTLLKIIYWDAFYEFSRNGDLEAARAESGYVHPVVSPLAIVSLLHPENTDLLTFLTDQGAHFVHHRSIRGEELKKYLK